jgi:hypothetical protein
LFLDFNNWRNPWSDQKTRLRLLILGTGFLMMAAWMLLPLPDWVGKPLLWNHVQAARMQFAGGIADLPDVRCREQFWLEIVASQRCDSECDCSVCLVLHQTS